MTVVEQQQMIEEKVSCCCRTVHKSSADASSISVISAVYFFSYAVSGMAIKYLVNQRIAGDAYRPNSESAFTDITLTLIRSVASFIMGRYTCGLGDYVGRKPVLLLSTSALVITRLIFFYAQTATVFYGAGALHGALDCFYYCAVAWLCDLYPQEIRRSARIGQYAGQMAAVVFIIALPLGLVTIEMIGVRIPIVISMIGGAVCCIMMMMTKVNDTVGVRSDSSQSSHLYGDRYVPRDFMLYATEHFPISKGSWALIKDAGHPLDWLCVFLLQITVAVMFILFVQYMLVVYHFTPILTGACMLFAGAAIVAVAPVVMKRYHPVQVAFYCGCIFTLGCLLIALSGSGISLNMARILGILGTICLGLGLPFAPAYQVILTSQYESSAQGMANGMLNQIKELSILPGYLISLMFSFSLRDGSVLPHGSPFYVAAVLGVCALALHYHSYGQEAVILAHKSMEYGVTGNPNKVPLHCLSTCLLPSRSCSRVEPFDNTDESILERVEDGESLG